MPTRLFCSQSSAVPDGDSKIGIMIQSQLDTTYRPAVNCVPKVYALFRKSGEIRTFGAKPVAFISHEKWREKVSCLEEENA